MRAFVMGRWASLLLIALALYQLPRTAVSAAFDCSKASTSVEVAICGDETLGAADETMAALYEQALQRSSSIQAEQAEWLEKVRNPCQTDECLAEAYSARIEHLQKMLLEPAKTEVVIAPGKPKAKPSISARPGVGNEKKNNIAATMESVSSPDRAHENLVWIAFVIAVVLVPIAIGAFRHDHAQKIRAKASAEIARLIAADAVALERNEKQLRIPNEYGIVDEGQWDRELTYYFNNKIRPNVSNYLYAAFVKEKTWSDDYRQIVHAAIQRVRAQRLPTEEFDSDDPYEYEEFCAEQLRQAGWDARPTSRSGDFGIDVKATHGQKILVLECKLHSGPIGSPVVQKTEGGRRHYGADVAAVISSSGFTERARKAASTTGVHLLHHSQLRDWARTLAVGEQGKPSTEWQDSATKLRTHYDNLQIQETASDEVIRGAYKHLSQKWHPDKNPDQRSEAERVSKLLNEAYAVLSDPVRRKEHDHWIRQQRAKRA